MSVALALSPHWALWPGDRRALSCRTTQRFYCRGRRDGDVMDRLLLRPEEAAEVLGVGRSKLFELLASGAIASVRIGSSRRVPRAALEEFVDRLHTEATGRLPDANESPMPSTDHREDRP